MHSSTIAGLRGLPIEIIEDIFLHVKAAANAAALARCVLCCKVWRDIVQPILCSHVVITCSNIEPFVNSFRTVYSPMTESVTTTMIPVYPANLTVLWKTAGLEKEKLRALLGQTSGILPSMVNIRTFSLTVSSGTIPPFRIPGSTVASIVQSLPEKCANLELVIQGLDYEKSGTTTTHICDYIRDMIPRLCHLRLRLRDLCPAFLGTGFDPSSSEYFHNFLPVLAPNLETLVINCMLCETYNCICFTPLFDYNDLQSINFWSIDLMVT